MRRLFRGLAILKATPLQPDLDTYSNPLVVGRGRSLGPTPDLGRQIDDLYVEHCCYVSGRNCRVTEKVTLPCKPPVQSLTQREGGTDWTSRSEQQDHARCNIDLRRFFLRRFWWKANGVAEGDADDGGLNEKLNAEAVCSAASTKALVVYGDRKIVHCGASWFLRVLYIFILPIPLQIPVGIILTVCVWWKKNQQTKGIESRCTVTRRSPHPSVPHPRAGPTSHNQPDSSG